MDAFLTSAITVALAEIGDKTQLLALLLTARFRSKATIVSAILVSTLINHALSAWLGEFAGSFLDPAITNYVLATSFVIVGLWLLLPDKHEGTDSKYDHYGAFVATFILFTLAEMGDKTQVATILLGAEYQSFWMVTLGTTFGMMIANTPVVYFGHKVIQKIPVRRVHSIAAGIFIGLGVFTLLW